MTTLTDARRPAADPTAAARPARVNLLPPGIAARSRLRRVQAGVGCGLLAVAGVVASLSVVAAAAVEDADTELAAVSARGAVLQAESAEYVDVLAVHRRAEAAHDMLALAMSEEVRFSELLDDLSRTVPDNVWLEDVTFSQPAVVAPTAGGVEASIGTVTFTGMALSHDDVADWLESLTSQEGYANPSLTDSTAGRATERRTVSFSSTVTLTSAALSGRHTSTTAQG
jgi:Tfp pilus assembly protein PilN